MKAPIFTIFFLCLSFTLSAQCPSLDCDCMLRKARELRQNNEYQKALNKLDAFRLCDPRRVNVAEQEAQGILQDQVAEQTALRVAAEEAAKSAERNAEIARVQRRRADQEAVAAKEAAERAEAAAMANLNAVKTLQVARNDKTLAMRMAMKNYELFPYHLTYRHLLFRLMANLYWRPLQMGR